MSAIFEGIKILDLTRVVAGPLCTQNMADMGATVYKIEKPGEGDDTRRMLPFIATGDGDDGKESAVFLAYNRGKQSITVDIAQPEGAALVRELASRCDVVVENYKAGSLAKYGLDYATLRQRKPDLIYCSVTGFGQSGPYAARPAYDFVLQGMAGPMSTCGLPDGEAGGKPLRTSIPICDIVTGLYATVAVTSALYHRQRTGQGQYIDAAMLDASVALNGHIAVGYLLTGKVPQRAGNTNPIAAPSEVFRCIDGLVIVAAGNNRQFTGLCEVVGWPELTRDERFVTNASRVANRVELVAILAPVLQAYRRDELLARLLERGVPSGPINDMAQVFADEQSRHRELAMPLRHASGTDVTLVRNPLRFSESPVEHRTPPLLGQHSEQVLAEELGLTNAQIQGLRERGIL